MAAVIEQCEFFRGDRFNLSRGDSCCSSADLIDLFFQIRPGNAEKSAFDLGIYGYTSAPSFVSVQICVTHFDSSPRFFSKIAIGDSGVAVPTTSPQSAAEEES